MPDPHIKILCAMYYPDGEIDKYRARLASNISLLTHLWTSIRPFFYLEVTILVNIPTAVTLQQICNVILLLILEKWECKKLIVWLIDWLERHVNFLVRELRSLFVYIYIFLNCCFWKGLCSLLYDIKNSYLIEIIDPRLYGFKYSYLIIIWFEVIIFFK